MTILQTIENSIIEIRGVPVILDSDVAALYDVETRELAQAVKNNPDKFPTGYILSLTNEEWGSLADLLRSKFLILNGVGRGKHVKYIPKAFTEQGLYMLATILKSRNRRKLHCQARSEKEKQRLTSIQPYYEICQYYQNPFRSFRSVVQKI